MSRRYVKFTFVGEVDDSVTDEELRQHINGEDADGTPHDGGLVDDVLNAVSYFGGEFEIDAHIIFPADGEDHICRCGINESQHQEFGCDEFRDDRGSSASHL